jgi:TonB family protein
MPAPAFLEAWQAEERQQRWLMPALIAGGALLAGLMFALSGEEKSELASTAEPATSAATAMPVPEPKQEPAPTAAVEPSPEAVMPSEIELQAEAPRKRDGAPRKRERARSSRAREPLDEELEAAPTHREAEQPPALPIAQAVTTSPAPNEAETTAIAASAVEPLPTPIKPAPAPSATRGPTRAAVVIHQVTPRFPMRAKRIGVEQGVVTLEFTIDKSGAVKDAVVVTAEPARVFEEEALKALAHWRYQPKLVNGTPAESRRRFTFHFE